MIAILQGLQSILFASSHLHSSLYLALLTKLQCIIPMFITFKGICFTIKNLFVVGFGICRTIESFLVSDLLLRIQFKPTKCVFDQNPPKSAKTRQNSPTASLFKSHQNPPTASLAKIRQNLPNLATHYMYIGTSLYINYVLILLLQGMLYQEKGINRQSWINGRGVLGRGKRTAPSCPEG